MKTKRIWDKLNIGTAIAAAALLLTFAAQRTEAQLIPLVEWNFDDPIAVLDATNISPIATGSTAVIGGGSFPTAGSPLVPLPGSTNTDAGGLATFTGTTIQLSASFGPSFTVDALNQLVLSFDYQGTSPDFNIQLAFNGGAFSTIVTSPVNTNTILPGWNKFYFNLSGPLAGFIPFGTSLSDVSVIMTSTSGGSIQTIDTVGFTNNVIPEPTSVAVLAFLAIGFFAYNSRMKNKFTKSA